MEKAKTVIRIDDMKFVINAILDHVKNDLGINEVELSKEFYWEITEESLYSMDRDKCEMAVGSLFDDLEFLSSILKNREQAVSLMLLHAAPLLRYLGTKVEQ